MCSRFPLLQWERASPKWYNERGSQPGPSAGPWAHPSLFLRQLQRGTREAI